MARIRLKRPEMKNFNSTMGAVQFKNGVSVDHVSQAEARLLGSITQVEWITEEGETRNAGMGQEHVDVRQKQPAVETALKPEGEPNTPGRDQPARRQGRAGEEGGRRR